MTEMTMKIPPAPADLGAAAGDLWAAVVGEWELRPDEIPLLTAACRTLDEIETIEAALVDAEPLVEGSRGQVRANPLFGEARQHRLALRQLLGALGIEEAEGEEGKNGAARSNAGRKLAAARWGGRRG